MSTEKYLFENISKHYIDELGHPIFLLKDINFVIEKKKLTSIISPVGSGKSSLLKIIAGLEISDENNYQKLGNVIYIPSEPSSFPWMDVQENITFGLENYKDDEISEIVKLVGLEGYEEHKPHNDSIGFRFRISLARAIVRKPDLIVIDEPFNNISQNHKLEIYQMLLDVIENSSNTILLATTNITEAICISQKIVLLKSDPGEVIGKMDIDFEDKNITDILESDKLNRIHKEIEEIINEQNKLVNYTV